MTPNPDLQAIEDLKGLLEKASPGDWKAWGMGLMADPVGRSDLSDYVRIAAFCTQDAEGRPRTHDLMLAIAMKAALPSLLSKAHEAEGLVAQLAHIDGVLARRPALDDFPERIDKILKTLKRASQADVAEAQAEGLAKEVERLKGQQMVPLTEQMARAQADLYTDMKRRAEGLQTDVDRAASDYDAAWEDAQHWRIRAETAEREVEGLKAEVERLRGAATDRLALLPEAAARIAWIEAELADEPNRPIWGIGSGPDVPLRRNGHEVDELELELAELKLAAAEARILQLKAENRALREAAKPFSDLADIFDASEEEIADATTVRILIDIYCGPEAGDVTVLETDTPAQDFRRLRQAREGSR